MKNQILFIVISIIIVSCTKKYNEYPTQIQTGNMIGFVTLYDENGNLIQNKSGVNISVNGLSTFNVLTDTNGRFEIDRVPTGTYNINFTKNGFSETKRVGYEFVGGVNPTLLTQILSMPTSTTVNLLSLTFDTTSKQVKANFKLNNNGPVGSYGYIRFYYGLSDTVSFSNYDFTVSYGYSKTKTIDTLTHNVSITGITQNNYYGSGAKVYFIAYGSPINSSSYTDINTGKTIYPGLNPIASQKISLVLP